MNFTVLTDIIVSSAWDGLINIGIEQKKRMEESCILRRIMFSGPSHQQVVENMAISNGCTVGQRKACDGYNIV